MGRRDRGGRGRERGPGPVGGQLKVPTGFGV